MDDEALLKCMNVVLQITDQAGKVMKEGFYGDKKIEYKRGNWDIVTDYDKKVEKLIIDALREKYPSHQFVGEESSVGQVKQSGAPIWLIDPIDGTYNYAHGFPATCISVGLVIDGQVVLGVVYNPMTKDQYTAIRGRGAFHNGYPIHVSKQPALQDALVSFEISIIRFPQITERTTKRYLAITHKTNGVRILGCAALSLCMVASGGLDAFVHEFLQPWDIAAGSLILEEAGGYVCHTNGDSFSTMGKNVLAAANKQIADDILNIFKEFP